jgi:hypothetical protein
MAKQISNNKNIRSSIVNSVTSISLTIYGYLKNNPYLSAILIISLYLIIFQNNFVTTGDAWAESYAEYLDESVRLGWSEVFAQNWAGYFSLIPSFIAKLYVFLHLPIGYIDWFYRGIVILFAIFTTSLFALKVNRAILKSDSLRILLSLAITIILFDITSFSFINIWYIAFLPILFSYLNHEKISNKADVSLGIFGALVSLTKPFLIILPIIIYRAIRSRQWIGPIVFLAATTLQIYQIIFNDRRQLVENASLSITETIGGIFVGCGISLLKLIGIMPLSLWFIVIANVALLALLILLWRRKGFWTAGILGATYIYAVYTYVLAPDLPAYHGLHNFAMMYSFDYKTQREIIINGVLMISIFLLLGSYLESWNRSKNNFVKKYKTYIILSICLVLLVVVYKPIDTTSAGVSTTPVNSFRSDLNNNLPSCVPLSPTPVYVADTNWVYAHKGTCHTPNHDTNIFKPDFTNMNIPADNVTFKINASYFRLDDTDLVAVVIPLINTSKKSTTLTIKNDNGKIFSSNVESKEGIQFVTFNTRGLDKSSIYKLVINQQYSGLYLGHFINTDSPVVYTYFLQK